MPAPLPPPPVAPRAPLALPPLSAPTTPQRPQALDRAIGRGIDAALDDAERAFDGGLTFDDLDELDVAMPVVALTEVRKVGEAPFSPDLTAELATRRHPKLSAHDLGLLDLEILQAPGTASAPARQLGDARELSQESGAYERIETDTVQAAIAEAEAEAAAAAAAAAAEAAAAAAAATEAARSRAETAASAAATPAAAEPATPAAGAAAALSESRTNDRDEAVTHDAITRAAVIELPDTAIETPALASNEAATRAPVGSLPAVAPIATAAPVAAPASDARSASVPDPAAASAPVPVPVPVPASADVDASGISLDLPPPLPPPPTDFDDEPTQPPAPDAEPPERLHAAMLRGHARTVAAAGAGTASTSTGSAGTAAGTGTRAGDGGTFAAGFTGTLAELAPDGSALDGPLGVFSMLPPDAANELARRAVVKLYDAGEVIVREGDAGDSCFVIVRGDVVVTRAAGAGEPAVELARLGEGALFGEFAILADRRRHATVIALVDAEIYVIPRLLLRELAAVYPDVGPALERFYRERLLANLLQTSPLFARLAIDERAGLLASFEPMRVESGEALVRQGEPAGGLFLIVLGAVEVVCRTDDRRAVVLATLGEGAYVGEISLLTGEVATASVVACGPVELAALPASSFYQVVSEYPELWAAMHDEARARRLRTERVLHGRTAVV
jgi:CRP-like cAMP-binding protein